MWKLWWKSSSSQTKKWQQTLEVNTKTKQNKKLKKSKKKTDEHSKTQWKPTDCNRIVTVDRVKKLEECYVSKICCKLLADTW